MSWNYRIVYHDTAKYPYYALHEIYYDDDGEIYLWAEEPELVVAEDEGVDGMKRVLEMMLNDVERSREAILNVSTLPGTDKEG